MPTVSWPVYKIQDDKPILVGRVSGPERPGRSLNLLKRLSIMDIDFDEPLTQETMKLDVVSLEVITLAGGNSRWYGLRCDDPEKLEGYGDFRPHKET